ncbi:M15 family metallopeptidase [Chitinophaga agrisoli]|uniref:D-alanyl-D-alanine dipeptidase n=1 Tax=Chitinophaga agrisoli TaxID=2607653 RepID=A0A5B2VSZ7_9BACT|nr:M15 family metallopeptidase [Chitinophaga agrisoli]KAA2241934.1 M15 family metallopeptidase [Chitinophaga agrisoli]
MRNTPYLRHHLKAWQMVCCLLLLHARAFAQTIPLNKYGLPVVDNMTLYRQLVAADSNQRLVDLRQYIPGIRTDVRYGTTDNFTHQVLYPHPRVFLRLPAAKALKAIQAELQAHGLGLLIFDGYRPYRITEKMWEIVPDDRYAADPRRGSGHNRGIAVDLTVIQLSSGQPLPMPTGYDDFTEKAHYSYQPPDSAVRANRAFLRRTMEKYGFSALETEWWHFYLTDLQQYPLLDLEFEALTREAGGR